ncbi:MAG TPA: DUF4386 domain-containing protein [Longimicrobiales bacterium]|nr:DUF4386 domain-containing protein [Longimicrobiales bacterium]
MTESLPDTPIPTRTLARLTGLLYLVIIVCAGFSEGVVRSGLVVAGDAAATAENILASQGLFRLGLVMDLVAFLADAAVAVLLYLLLKPVSRTVSLMAAAFRLVAHPAIGGINLVNHFGALLLLTGEGTLAAFDPGQREALALLAMDAHGYGYLIAGAFFGVHLALLGYLLFRSERFPRVLGVLVGAAAVGYLVESFTIFLLPQYTALATGLVVATAVMGEVSLCLWLLVRGVRRPG